MSKNFTDLDCWKKGRELRLFLTPIIKTLPVEERYVLADQMKRAAYSVTLNIAEGYGRFHFQETIQYCRQSRGSLYEIWDTVIICEDNQYISVDTAQEAFGRINICIQILNGYIKYLKEQKEKFNKD